MIYHRKKLKQIRSTPSKTNWTNTGLKKYTKHHFIKHWTIACIQSQYQQAKPPFLLKYTLYYYYYYGFNCIFYYPQFRAILNFRARRKKRSSRSINFRASFEKHPVWRKFYRDVPKQLFLNSFSPINHSGHLLRQCGEGWAAELREDTRIWNPVFIVWVIYNNQINIIYGILEN